MEADWDLLAVVRGCTSTTTTATTGGALQAADLHQNPPPPATLPRITAEAAFGGFFSSGCEDLGDLYKPFFPNLKCPPISTTLAGGGFIREQRPHPQQQLQQPQQIVFQQHPQQQQVKESQVIFGSSASSVAPPCTAAGAAASIISVGSIFTSQSQRTSVRCSPTTTTAATTSQTQQRAKKRKNLQKRVCHVPAEGLSSDMWAWRKYGQKPIKGSPYPRGYYRCSSSKGCPARKQVERNRSNPKMFIVTYTAEHNHPMPTHRNSLAGSTRQKPGSASDEATAASPSTNSTGNDHPSSPTASPSSAMTEKGEVKTEYEEDMAKDESSGNEMEFPEMVMNDDFFVGFEELDDMDTGDVFLDQIQGRMEMEYPWLSNSSSSSSTATAAGGS